MFRTANRWQVKDNMGAAQGGASSHDVATFKIKVGTHLFKAFEVLIHGSCTNGATAWQRDPGPSKTC